MKNTILGNNIKRARTLKHITQRVLAEKINLSCEMISRYETGKVNPLRNIDKIAAALDVPIHLLFEEKFTYPYFRDESPRSCELHNHDIAPYVSSAPLLTSKNFKLSDLGYYPIPLWIKNSGHKNVFVLKLEGIIINPSLLIDNDGNAICEITEKISNNDVVVYTSKDDISKVVYINIYNKINNVTRIKIIRKVLLYEKRFV